MEYAATEQTMEEIRRNFALNLKYFRAQSGLSQLKLAIEADLSPNYINELEQGRRMASFDSVAVISAALAVEPYRFFLKPGEEIPPPDEPKDEERKDEERFLSSFETCLQAYSDFKKRYSG